MSAVEKNIRETFARLYEEYMPKVFRYVQYKVNNIQLTEDLTSAVFEKALVNFNKYSSDKASFSTWIFSIARNTVIDYFRVERKKETKPLEEATEIPSTDLSPDEELLKTEERDKLYACLAQLPQDEQEIIRLKFGAEMTNRQIAKVLGLSETNVGTKLYRTVRKLRDGFRESGNG